MSPYPARTDLSTIVTAACQIIESQGVENLSLKEVAGAVGVQTPSLYNHIRGKKELLRLVVERTFRELFAAYQPALEDPSASPKERLLRLFRLHRAYAHAHPNAYTLAYSTRDPELRADPAELESQAIAVQQVMAGISGPGALAGGAEGRPGACARLCDARAEGAAPARRRPGGGF